VGQKFLDTLILSSYISIPAVRKGTPDKGVRFRAYLRGRTKASFWFGLNRKGVFFWLTPSAIAAHESGTRRTA